MSSESPQRYTMALFASSLNPSSSKSPLATANPFSTTFTAPSTTPVIDPSATSKRTAKRTRTSDASAQHANRSAAYGERSSVKSAQDNIERLMKVLEKGDGVAAAKKSGKKGARRKSGGGIDQDDDDAPLTIDELRKRIAEEEAQGQASTEQPPKKKKIKYGLDGRPVLPPGVSSIAELEGKAKPKPKPAKKAQQAPQAKVPGPEPSSDAETSEAEDEDPSPPVAQAPMTHLQSSLAHKLSSAKFRWLNEQLYTLPSTQAWDLMRKEGGSAFADVRLAPRLFSASPFMTS